MTILRSTRARLGVLTVGLAAAAVPVLSQSASASVQSCDFVLERVTAVDVQEGGRGANKGDEIILKLDGERFPSTGSAQFPVNATIRNHPSFQSPVVGFADDNPLSVELIELDLLFNDQIGNTKSLECTGNQRNQTLVFKETGVEYHMRYHVNLLD